MKSGFFLLFIIPLCLSSSIDKINQCELAEQTTNVYFNCNPAAEAANYFDNSPRLQCGSDSIQKDDVTDITFRNCDLTEIPNEVLQLFKNLSSVSVHSPTSRY